jgi:hypothetical protein
MIQGVQIILILLISYIGTEVQRLLHIPLAGSIVGLLMFYLLLQPTILPAKGMCNKRCTSVPMYEISNIRMICTKSCSKMYFNNRTRETIITCITKKLL